MFDGKTFFTIYDLWMLIITLPTEWDGEAEHDVCGNAVCECSGSGQSPQNLKAKDEEKKEKRKPIRIKLRR
jgi:hypothetical protein